MTDTAAVFAFFAAGLVAGTVRHYVARISDHARS